MTILPKPLYCDYCKQDAFWVVIDEHLICKQCCDVKLTDKALKTAAKIRVSEIEKMLVDKGVSHKKPQ